MTEYQRTQRTKNPGSCALVVYIAGDALHHQPMGAGHMTVLQLCGPMGMLCPAMVSPNASLHKRGQAVVPG